MLNVWERSYKEALEAEILQYELQSCKLAKEDGIQEEICIYCGYPKQVRDHVIPFSVMLNGNKRERTFSNEGPIVRSCNQCNIILSNKIFRTFRQRIEFVCGKYKKIEKNITKDASSLWCDDDMEEYGKTLRSYLKAGIAYDRKIKNKIKWINRMLEKTSSD